MTSSQANTVVDDFELDYVEMYVRDMDEQVVLWRDSYGFVEAAVGGSPEQGFRATVMSQGAMRLVLTEATAERHPASDYVLAHGDGIANIALRTGDVRSAFRQAVDNGAQVLAEPVEHAGDDVAVSATVSGFGDVVHTLVQRRSGQEAGLPAGFRPFPGSAAPTEPVADGLRLLEIDHFAVCANVGELDAIVELYERSFGFDEIFTERIVVGSQAMLSKVVQSKSGEVTFTILQPDPAADPGQIDEFLKNHVGSGVQHVAFAADDVVRSVGALAGRGVEFLTTPDAYYSLLKQRISLSKHSLESLHELNVLVDEDHAGQLFQIFARSTHPRRTLFFEVIERCGAQTFGSSNIKALYEAVEMERLAHQNDSLLSRTVPAGEAWEVDRDVHCLEDMEQAAREAMPADVWDFVAGGSGDEVTLAANRAALRRIALVPRILRDVARCDPQSSLFGVRNAMPVAVAPIAYHKLVHPEGELASARAAKVAGVPFTASTLSSCTIEAITGVGGTVWFQLYWLRDRKKTFELVERAEAAGCAALMPTVDVPWMGRRLRDVRNRFTCPPGWKPPTWRGDRAPRPIGRRRPDPRWPPTPDQPHPLPDLEDIEELRRRTSLPIILKGVLAAEDARRAVDAGADGIVVSNHGGRQLDGAVPGVDVLAEIAAKVGGDCRVLLDGGIRSGTDVLRALALGADGVLVGRPVLWGLAAAGERGVGRVLGLLAEELRDALGLAGCDGVQAAARSGP